MQNVIKEEISKIEKREGREKMHTKQLEMKNDIKSGKHQYFEKIKLEILKKVEKFRIELELKRDCNKQTYITKLLLNAGDMQSQQAIDTGRHIPKSSQLKVLMAKQM